MTLEAAERLMGILASKPVTHVQRQLLTDALAAERRATVERIRHQVLFTRNRLGQPPEKIRVTDLLAILDAELSA